MPSNTTYNPPNINSFVKSALTFNAQGVNKTVDAGSTSNLDYVLTDDCLLTGLEFIASTAAYSDTVNLQVIDHSGAITGTAGTVILQPATNWNVAPKSNTQFDLTYPAKLVAGMALRAVYTSTGPDPVFIAVNYKLHKCLI